MIGADPRKRRRRLLLLFALLSIGGALWFLRTQYAWDTACGLARSRLPEALNADVQLGACELDPLTQAVVLKDVEVRPRDADKDAPPLFSAERVEVALGGVHPFFRSVELDRVSATRPQVTIDLRKPRAESSEKAQCSLDPLKRVEVNKLGLKDAKVTVLLPEDRRVEIGRLDVGWTLRRGTADFEVEARDGVVALGNGSPDLALTRLFLQGTFSADDEEVEFSRAEVGVDDVSLTWTGRVEELCDPTLSLEAQLFLPLRTLAKVAPLPQPVGGHVWSRISLSGKATEPIATLEVAGSEVKLERFLPGDFRANLSYAGKNVTLNALTVPFADQGRGGIRGAGMVKASGALQLIPGFPVTAKAEVDNVSLARVLERVGISGAWVDFGANGRGQITGKLFPLELAGEADIKTRDFLLASRAFDAPEKNGKDILQFPSAHVTTNLRVLPDHVELSNIQASSANTAVRADVTLNYDPNRGLAIKGSSEQIDLSDFKELAGIHWAGKGGATFNIVGPYQDVVVDAQLSLRDFEFWDFNLGVVQGKLTYADNVLKFPGLSGQKGRTAFSGNGELDFAWKDKGAKESELYAKGHVTVPRGRVEDIVDIIVPMNDSIEIFQGTLAGEVSSAQIDIECPVEKLAGTIKMEVAGVTYYDRPVGKGRIDLTLFDGVGMRLEPTVLTGELGITHADGTFLYDGPLDYRFRMDNYSLKTLVGEETAKKAGIDGTLTMVGKVEGDSTTPVVNAYLTAPKIIFSDKPLGAMHLEGRIQGKDLTVWGRPFDDARLQAKMKLKEPYAYVSQLSLTLPEIRPLLPAAAIAQGVSGSVAGTFTASGSIKNDDDLEASAQIDKLTLSRGADFSGANDGPIMISYEKGRLQVDAFAFKGPNTEITAQGWAGPSTMDMKLRANVDMRLVESFMSTFERTAGRIDLTAAATGSVKAPSVVGSAVISDARMSLRDQPISIRGVNGRVEFSEARVLLQELRGIVNNQGTISMRGDLRLERFAMKHLEVGIVMDDILLRPRDYLSTTIGGELLLHGKPDAMMLDGDVDIQKLRYEQDVNLQSMLADARKPAALGGQTTLEKPKEWLKFNVDIRSNASSDIRVENSLARAKLAVALNLVGNNVTPGLVGHIEALDGSEAFYRGNKFAISQGLVEFKDRKSLDPENVELRAETQVREFLVKLHTFGRPSSPSVILTAEPELSEADILSLLTLGIVSRDRGNATGVEAGAGLAAEAFLSASGLGNQVQRFLPKNRVFRDMSFHLATTYNDASGLVEPTAQLESKFLTDELKLHMTQPVSGRGTRAGAEWRVNDRTSIQGQWDNENSDYSFGNLGLELKLRWEVE